MIFNCSSRARTHSNVPWVIKEMNKEKSWQNRRKNTECIKQQKCSLFTAEHLFRRKPSWLKVFKRLLISITAQKNHKNATKQDNPNCVRTTVSLFLGRYSVLIRI